MVDQVQALPRIPLGRRFDSNSNPLAEQESKKIFPQSAVQTMTAVALKTNVSLNISPRLSDYEKVDTLTLRGGMSKIFLARQSDNPETVVLKETSEEPESPYIVNEVLALMILKHQNIVRLKEVGGISSPGFVMEYLKNAKPIISDYEEIDMKDLQELSRFLRNLASAAKTVHYMHGVGVIHRDLKPDNILIYSGDKCEDKTTVIDFGTSKINRPDLEAVTPLKEFKYCGTLDFMSPEQEYDANMCNSSSDVYSLAVILYHALAGDGPIDFMAHKLFRVRSPFETQTPMDIRMLNNKIKNKELAEVLLKAVAKEQHDRIFQSADDFAGFVENIKPESIFTPAKSTLVFVNP